MIELIIIGISIGIVISTVIDGSGIMEWVKRKLYYLRYTKQSPYQPYQLKPFDCGMCLSWWLTIITLSILIQTFTFITILFILTTASISSIVSVLLRRWVWML